MATGLLTVPRELLLLATLSQLLVFTCHLLGQEALRTSWLLFLSAYLRYWWILSVPSSLYFSGLTAFPCLHGWQSSISQQLPFSSLEYSLPASPYPLPHPLTLFFTLQDTPPGWPSGLPSRPLQGPVIGCPLYLEYLSLIQMLAVMSSSLGNLH